MKKIYYLSIAFVIFIILAFFGQNCSGQKGVSENEYSQGHNGMSRTYSPEIPDKLYFADEAVPLGRYYVREGLDRELLVNTYWHTSTLLLFKRANRWFPVIEPILKKNNIPEDFKYLALIESGLTNAVSPSGAKGFWQFLEGTAKDYGLEVDEQVDERYHVEKATEAACQYMLDAYERFGDWILVAAGYNAGLNRIGEELELQMVDNYYDLFLNEETSRYVFRILAIKTIFNDPTKYGFHLMETDLYPPIPTKKVIVDQNVDDLRAFSIEIGINYRILKEMNPWLRKDYLNLKSREEYVLLIPKKKFLEHYEW
ncbi:MAG: lytic transglycosylase domain-containing protein [Bacteroidota bacterium]|nr:lytic transglycosylase domain-containing protein [Bacteroidota bacterium]